MLKSNIKEKNLEPSKQLALEEENSSLNLPPVDQLSDRSLRVSSSDDTDIVKLKTQQHLLFSPGIEEKEGLEFLNSDLRNVQSCVFNHRDKNLFKIDTSKDKEVIELINNDHSSGSLVKEFVDKDLNVYGTLSAKKISIEIFNRIKDHEFRDSEIGNEIYQSFRLFIGNINPSKILIENSLPISDGIIKNAYYYSLIALDFKEIEGIKDFAHELNSLLSNTNIPIPKQIDYTKSVSDIVDASLEKTNGIQANTNDQLDQLDSQKQPNILKLGKYLYIASKFMFANKIGMLVLGTGSVVGVSIVGNIVFSEAGKMVEGKYFSRMEPLIGNNRELTLDSSSKKESSDAFINLYKAIRVFWSEYWK